jgi:HAD superfamily hydrolase (TIGR01509 family)
VGDYFGRLAGRSDREIVELVVSEQAGGDPGLIELLLRERRDRYCRLVEARSPIETGTVELLALLREAGVPLAIVTGAQRVDVDFVLSQRGLQGTFSAVVTEEDVSRGKPHPEGFLQGASLLGVRPSGALVFEDSLFGLRAARAAGMSSIGLTGTKSRLELEGEADLIVDVLGPELLEAVLVS